MYRFTLLLLGTLCTSYASRLFVNTGPPKPWLTALMARYIIHKCDWVSISTISTMEDIIGYPYVTLKSVSDGPVENGTGVPYLYMTTMDVSGKDLSVNNRCTILATLAQSDYCKSEDFDPQDPRCAKLIITGRLVKVNVSSPEYEFGRNALFSRHPAMKSWPEDHDFFVAKIDIEKIDVLDFFGGLKDVSIEDYFNASTYSQKKENLHFDSDDINLISVDVI